MGVKKNYYKDGHIVSDSCSKSDRIYLDHNATYTQIEEELRSVLDSYNNDDSRYEIYNEDKIFYGKVEFDSWLEVTPANLEYPFRISGAYNRIVERWSRKRST